MFKIHKDQMEAYRQQRIGPGRLRIMEALRKALPQETARYSTEEFGRLCDRGIYKANQYGIGTEYNLYRFIAAMVLFGEDFDINPKTAWSQEFLRDKAMEEDHKAKLLELRITMDKGKGI